MKIYLDNEIHSPQLSSGGDNPIIKAAIKNSTVPYNIEINPDPKIVLPPTLDVDIYNYYQIRLNITQTVNDIDKYKIYRKKDTGSYALVAATSCTGETTTWTDPDVNSSFQVNTFCYKVKAVDDYGIVSAYSNEECELGMENFKIDADEMNAINILPAKYSVSAYPNPFNPNTTFRVSLPEAGCISLNVYNSPGQVIFGINQYYDAGYHSIRFDGTKLSSGIYFYSLQVNSFHTLGKILLVK